MGKKLNIDLTGVESFQRAAEGIHNVKVATTEIKQSQGGNDMIVVSFEVTKGADKGARVYENFPLVDTALWKLKNFLQAIGMKADGKISLDVDRLVGKTCAINVKHEEYEGKLRARVESIMKLEIAEADSDDEDEDDDIPFEEEESKPTKKAEKPAAKKAPINPPEEEDEDDDWDEDEEEEEEEVKPAKKSPKKPEAPAKKPAKKPAADEDDDWDDEDWDEA